MDRRAFLSSYAAALAAAASANASPAPDAAKPVRDTPLRSTYYGPEYYDDQEMGQLREVFDARQPFRWYGPGKTPPKKVLAFEKALASRMETKYALAVTSGSAALVTALAALGVGPGDEVILPAWGWYSCVNAVVLAGALPVFADVDASFNLDPAALESKITPQTKAIMVVHILGCPADMDPILAVARKHGVKVLEDCAQSVGASYKGKPIGSLGDVGIYSFHIAKIITAGEGGGLVTNDANLFERATRYHDLGLLRPPHQEWLGGARGDALFGNQYRLNEFSGGVLLAQLSKLDTIVGALRGHARTVYEGIADLPGLELRRRPDPDGDIGTMIWLGFPARSQRDQFLAAMRAENVPAGPPLEVALLPLLPAVEKKTTTHPNWPSFASERGKAIKYGPACCEKTVEVHRRFAGITLDPKFSREDIQDVIAAIRKVYPKFGKA